MNRQKKFFSSRTKIRLAWRRAKEMILGQKGQDVLVFLFFLLVSFGFWLLQTLDETFDIEIPVSLELKGVPNNVLITTPLPSEARVTLHDRGTILVSHFLRHNLRPVVINFDQYDDNEESGHVRVSLQDVQRAVQSQLSNSTHITAIRPDTLEFYYNRGLAYTLPVELDARITTNPQHYVKSITLQPDSVMVYAPIQVLDTMKVAHTQLLSKSDLDETTEWQVPFKTIKGVRYEPNVVTVRAIVDYYTEKTVEVPIVGVNFPAEKKLRTFPSKAKITFRVGSADFQRITADNFVLAITYEELINYPQEKFPLHLKSMPEGASNARVSPQEVDYLIEQISEEENPEQ